MLTPSCCCAIICLNAPELGFCCSAPLVVCGWTLIGTHVPLCPQVLLDSLLGLQPRTGGGGGGIKREDLVMNIATDLLEQVCSHVIPA